MHQPLLRGRPVLARKEVLLLDPYQPTRDARAGVLKNHEIELDSVESLQAARCLWRPRLYDWILLDVRRYLPGEAFAFYDQIRDKSPHEHVAFFVGPRSICLKRGPTSRAQSKVEPNSGERR